MELQVQQVVVLCILRCNGLFHGADHGLHVVPLGGCQAGGQLAADQFVHGGAQVEDFQRFVQRNVAHEHAPVFFSAHQAGLIQHAKGFADGPARDPHFFSQGGFNQLAAGWVLATQDAAFDFLLHHHAQRAALQQGNGGVHGRAHGPD